ncbi:hypothetical protein K2173_004167 [Erythroxylum novogranatense]|uniref:NAC domain-containing protein n=1 Tax=Erythroxylum novogranatense TaxID=1862640 RepID=A0AAV8SXH2_9ROSI|nr:hypothetical protein K2173_004167 [Erythroxylum novogranatense]
MGSETPSAPPSTAAMTTASTTPAPPSPTAAKPTTAALAPGFRFHPTDEELVSYYLKRKVSNKPVRFDCIAEVDIYKNEPWDLSDKSRLKTRDQEWYFFGALDKKYGNGARMNRATGRGYWKATGKDREVRGGSQVIAMKKTLVFHSGRAPGGQRTNWVMHEYRLVDEELDRLRTSQNDSYVLCRVFHKNNIGPPSGNRYAPFVEEEWNDYQLAVIPREDAMEELMAGHDGVNHAEQVRNLLDSHSFSKDLHSSEECLTVSRNALPLCKTEKEENCAPLCVLNTEASFPLLQYKRRKHGNDTGSNRSNASEDSVMTLQDLGSSSTTTARAAAETRTAISALLEFSLMESAGTKEASPAPPRPKISPATLDSTVPPGCMKFIEDLQDQIHRISVEKESMRLEMMSAQAMISILQSHIELVKKENQELKRKVRVADDKKLGIAEASGMLN